MDKIKNDDLTVKSIDELFDDITAGPIVQFPDAVQEPTERYHCNLKKEPWQYCEKFTKPTVDFNAQNLKCDALQTKDDRTM